MCHARILERHAEGVFGPEDVTFLVAAFDEAWARLEMSGADYGSELAIESAREQLGMCIIELAKNGERDPRRLCENALFTMAQQTGASDARGSQRKTLF